MKLLISKVNFNKENLFLQATTSEEKAKSIIEHGLYTYGDDLGSFSAQWCGDIKKDKDIEAILAYNYGGIVESSMANDYIILFRMPSDRVTIEKLSKQEQEQAKELVVPRRQGLFSAPTHKVNKRDILGYLDKKKGQVVFNPDFIVLNDDKIVEDSTQDINE